MLCLVGAGGLAGSAVPLKNIRTRQLESSLISNDGAQKLLSYPSD